MTENSRWHWMVGAVGFLVGAFVGYLYRPPALFVGQLPFHVVISRGTNLKGLDQIYIPVAERSFNYLLGGGIAGAALGILAAFLVRRSTGRA